MCELPYYYRQSWGVGTNLQLHSLRQAWRLWGELQHKKEILKDRESRIRERCVVIVDLLGLSLTQLLGQNFGGTSTKIPPPKCLMSSFLKVVKLSEQDKKDIADKFSDFLSFYDGCRHFGLPKHEKINQLTFEITREFVELAIEIWDLVCSHFRSDCNAALNFVSVRDILDDDEDYEMEDKWK